MTETTYERILNAAYELFANNGYDATGMNAIAQAVGISKGALYHHFVSKEALVMKIMEDKIMVSALDAFPDFSNIPKSRFQKALIDCGLGYIKEARENAERKKFMMQIMPLVTRVDNLMEMFLPIIEATFEKVNVIIERGIEFGFVSKSVDKQLLAEKTFAQLDMVELYAAFDMKFQLERFWEDFVKDNYNTGAK